MKNTFKNGQEWSWKINKSSNLIITSLVGVRVKGKVGLGLGLLGFWARVRVS
jgi:hypothetical protein